MKRERILLVKPHPPKEILEQKCPITEKYKYSWEPIALKLIAYKLNEMFRDSIDVAVWHLIDENDDQLLLDQVKRITPTIVVFNEIDILVNEVNKLAKQIKLLSKDTTIIVGGKQTSLLRKGDISPFEGVDFGIRGDGISGINKIVKMKLLNKDIENIEGIVLWDDNRIILSEDTFSPRHPDDIIDNIAIHKMPVYNHTLEQYIEIYQSHPSIISADSIRTAPIYTGLGCPYNCFFCQSPVEFGKTNKVILKEAKEVAQEIFWLNSTYGVNNFFSLEPNVNLENLLEIYKELEKHKINQISISGFVRAADIVTMESKGLLELLVQKGVRILSIGLDIPLDSKKDIYNKSFSYQEMLECLDICNKRGIIVLATIIGNPELTRNEFDEFLQKIKGLPVAEVDIRLVIALRNTKFFNQVKQHLIYSVNDNRYYDRQNYRYQTLQYLGKIKPEETYALVKEFQKDFYLSTYHVKYVINMINNHPDTFPYFKRIYSDIFQEKKVSSVIELLENLNKKILFN